MKIYNIDIVLKDSKSIIEQIHEACCNVEARDGKFIFSAIIKDNILQLNCNDEWGEYDIDSVAKYLENNLYIRPSLDLWLRAFKPYMLKLNKDIAPRYSYMVSSDEALSILYDTIFNLYNKGYYLHNYLIRKSFINALNVEYRDYKKRKDVLSLDENVDNNDITYLDLIPDTSYDEVEERIAEEQKLANMKKEILKYITEYEYNHILFQMKYNIIDRRTSYILDKVRKSINPDAKPLRSKKK